MSRRPHTASSPEGTGLATIASILAVAALMWPAGRASATTQLKPLLVVWGYSEGASMAEPCGIAFDPGDGAIYVGSGGRHQIEVYSRTGRPLSRFVHRVRRPGGEMADGIPVALAFDSTGRLLVADQLAAYVDVLDRRGRNVGRLDIPASSPSALAIGKDGAIYVGTAGRDSRVFRFARDYSPAGSWGEAGAEPGRLFGVTALSELADGTLAVACSRTTLGIQIFTRDGRYLRGFATHELGKGCISLPRGVVGTADGRIWVLDEIRHNILVFDQDGNFIEQLGGRGAAPGMFAHPSSMAFDGKGVLAITDRELGRLQLLSMSDE